MNAPGPIPTPAAEPATLGEEPLELMVRRHLRLGWLSLLVFLTLGLVLEALHGWKVQAYLNAMNETRRLMWTLAHAHGALLGLVHLAFAFTVQQAPAWSGRARGIASGTLTAAGVLMPGGFFLGGAWIYAGDPGLGILLVPAGGVLLFVSVLLTTLGLKHFAVSRKGHASAKAPGRKG